MYRILNSKAVTWVQDNGKAEIQRCSWLVRVASGNPEPDSFSDTFMDIDCNAIVRSLDGTVAHTACDHGHEFHEMGSAEWMEQEQALAYSERNDDFDPSNSLAHVV